MSHIIHSTEGIILRVIPFNDYDQIASIFTPEVGLIKILHKGGRNKHRKEKISCMPLMRVEIAYREKKGEIFACDALHCIEMFPLLRTDLPSLETACDLLQVILDSQLMGKGAPQLYALLCYYLKKIPQTTHPSLLSASFRLKLLKHDGMVSFPFICCECRQFLQNEAFIRDAEGWCAVHRPPGSECWNSKELQIIYQLAEGQSYKEMCSVDMSPELHSKIALFFKRSLSAEF